jgi:ATP-binding cassette subfamily C (CFTR/MRP) protein 1
MGLLVYTLGVSALVGLGILIGVAPFQGWLFGKLMSYRGTQEKIVDQRVRLLTEIINNIRAVKLYAYETFFGKKVSELRTQELAKLKGSCLWVVSNISPTSAECPVTFVTYSLTGNQLNAAIVFSALQFFNVLREPISRLPMIIAAAIDAVVALGRIGAMLRVSLHSDLIRVHISSW